MFFDVEQDLADPRCPCFCLFPLQTDQCLFVVLVRIADRQRPTRKYRAGEQPAENQGVLTE